MPVARVPTFGRIAVWETGSAISESLSVIPYSNANGSARSVPSFDVWYSKDVWTSKAPFCGGLAVSVSSGCCERVVKGVTAKTSNPKSKTNRPGATMHTPFSLILEIGQEVTHL